MEPTNNIKERVFIVTGTSSGLGLSVVKKLLDNNFKVVAFTRSKLKVENEIKNYYENNNEKNNIGYLDSFLVVQVDITDQNSVELGVKETIEKFGHFDVVINNAGHSQAGNVEETSDEEARSIFDVNYFSLLNMIRATTPHLRKQKSGLILNVSSILGHAPSGGFSSYVASKYAVTGLTFSLRLELAPFNVKVVLLSPGAFKTDITNRDKFKFSKNTIADYYPNSTSEATFDNILKQFECNSKGSPDKFGEAILKVNEIHQQGKELPRNIFFGSDAILGSQIFSKLLLDEVTEWKELSLSTDL
ncbi:hypothetical protein ACTFIV_007717 [Dictyostelium citrinum]